MKNGGSAFPRQWPNDERPNLNGMSLRDFFAGIVLSKVASFAEYEFAELNKHVIGLSCEICYKYADAMLKEREKNEKNKESV